MASLSDLKKIVTGETKLVTPYSGFPRIEPSYQLDDESGWDEMFRHNGRRYYRPPNGGVYPSVTTFLKHNKDNSDIEAWKKRVGEDEAKRITKRSTDRGEEIHKALEYYIQGLPYEYEKNIGEFMFMFEQIRLRLHENLDGWVYMEHALYSEQMKIAGRCDLMGVWAGKRSIIDYKNKNRRSRSSTVEDYMIQTACYAIMHEERYKESIDQLVIVASVEKTKNAKAEVHVEPLDRWKDRVLDMNRRFLRECEDWYDIPPLLLL